MSELLNEMVTFTVAESQYISVPVDATLSIEGQAADAKATGDAIAALEAADTAMGEDIDALQLDMTDVQADLFLLVPKSDIDTTLATSGKVAESKATGDAIAALGTVVNGLNATGIPMSSTDTTKISAKIAAMDTAQGNAILKTSQTLTTAEQAQARTNIGALSADADVVHYGSQTLTAAQKAQVRANIDAKCLVVTGTMPTTGSVTISNTGITADMIVAEIYVATAGAVGGTWTWATADGSITLTGVCYAATNVTIYLVHTA